MEIKSQTLATLAVVATVLYQLVKFAEKKMKRRPIDAITLGIRESTLRTFGMHMNPALTKIDMANLKKGFIDFHIVVPPAWCREVSLTKDDKRMLVVSTSVIMALFDELSSMTLVAKDSSHRAGVSMHLSTEMLRPVLANEQLVMSTHTDKVGYSVAFCTLVLRTASGELVGRGKHIKFLPMGRLYDFLMHPLIVPTVFYFYNLFRGSRVKTFVDPILVGSNLGKKELPQWTESQTVTAKLFEDLKVSRVTDEKEQAECAEGSVYTIRVRPDLSNLMGMLHGGALGSAVDESIFRSREELCKKYAMSVNGVEMRYLNAMKGEILIQVWDDKASEELAPGVYAKTAGRVINKKNRAVCAEFTADWKLY